MAKCLEKYLCSLAREIRESYEKYYEELDKFNRMFSRPAVSKELMEGHKRYRFGDKVKISEALELISLSPCANECEEALTLMKKALELEPSESSEELVKYLKMLRESMAILSKKLINKSITPTTSSDALQLVQLLYISLRERKRPCLGVTCYPLAFITIYLFSKAYLPSPQETSLALEAVNETAELLGGICELTPLA